MGEGQNKCWSVPCVMHCNCIWIQPPTLTVYEILTTLSSWINCNRLIFAILVHAPTLKAHEIAGVQILCVPVWYHLRITCGIYHIISSFPHHSYYLSLSEKKGVTAKASLAYRKTLPGNEVFPHLSLKIPPWFI